MSASAGTVYYLHGQNNDLGYEKEVKDNGLVEHKHYLSAGGIVFAMQVTRTGNTATGGASGSAKPTQSLTYMHHDHLGSVSVLTDDSGSVIERLAYDPWGKRRLPNGTADTTDSIVGLTMDRGFTMHEHLDEMGVIHMNGRIYDPLIGRFMSADPFIQAPDNLQSHNRFAYVMNNPLTLTDPSGYFSLKKLFRAVVAIAVAWVTAGAVQPYMILNGYSVMAAKITAAAVGGFAGGLIASGGDLKAALQGAFTGGIFGGIGGFAQAGGWSEAARIGAHAVGGCITSVASGGGCGSGALNAAFGKFATIVGPGWVQNPEGFGQVAGGATYAAISGGIGSVLAGSKFENGAVTAAFGYLFNQVLTKYNEYQKNGPPKLDEKSRAWAFGNSWIDKDGNPIDTSERDRADGVAMADKASKVFAYGAAACTISVVCAPAAPGIAAAGVGASIAKDVIFVQNPAAFALDTGIDKALTTVGSFFKIPLWITVPLGEQIKDSKEASGWKDKQRIR
jgi:RHS repeat-associated protein